MSLTTLLTSESVSAGHPDMLCDLISDSILDACQAQDPTARVAIEAAIIDRLDLRRPIYAGTAAFGHFGRDDLPWETRLVAGPAQRVV